MCCLASGSLKPPGVWLLGYIKLAAFEGIWILGKIKCTPSQMCTKKEANDVSEEYQVADVSAYSRWYP